MNLENIFSVITVYFWKLLIALLIVFVGLEVIKFIVKRVDKRMEKTGVDETLRKFVVSLLGMGLKVLLVISAAGTLGIQMASFVAIIGAAGLAVGFALQGSLSNFAGGVLLILFKPFVVGDYIEGAGHAGVVKEIHILNTILTTVDNKKVIIPNANLSNGSVTNYSAFDTRRVDLNFGVEYDSDINKVKEILMDAAKANDLVIEDPAPVSYLLNHADSALEFVLRAWTKTENYWDVYFQLTEEVKRQLDANGIEIPYPHLDVKLKNQ